MMSSESATRRLLLAAGGLAAVGVTSLGLTLAASDSSAPAPAASEPAPPTSFATSTQPTETPVPATSAATVLPATVLPTTVVAATVPETTIPLEDGQVWVYNRSQNRVGLFDIGAGLLTWASRSLAELFGSLDYQANGGIAALFEKDTGRLWVGPANELVGAWLPERPYLQLAQGSRVVITATGRGLVVTRDGWYELSLDPNGNLIPAPSATPTEPTASNIPAPVTSESPGLPQPVPKQFNEDPGTTTVSAVGDKLVYLSSTGLLFTDDHQFKISGKDPVLQMAGPDNGSVLVASSDGLFQMDLKSGMTTILARGSLGAPARPVRVDECIFAAWSGQEPTWFKSCDGVQAPPTIIPGASVGAKLVFRVNGQSVALNEVDTGAVWVEEDGALTKASIEWAEVATEVRS